MSAEKDSTAATPRPGNGAADRGTIGPLILNSPYAEPTQYWQYDHDAARFEKKPGRRPAGYRLATPGSTDPNDPGVWAEIALVNRIRRLVARWRRNGYPGVSGTTLRLLRHWRDDERRSDRFFWCQLEAIETLIWLTESPATDRVGLRLPSDGGPFRRICSKMATGTGKTVVMAMLIAWQVLNRAAKPADTRFARNVLLVAPGRTVRERLAVLHPAGAGNYYDAFDIVPSGLRPKLREARVVVRNWQALTWEKPEVFAKKKGVDRRGPKSDRAWLRQVLGPDLAKAAGNLLVINDEGHHAWRIPAGFRSTELTKTERDEATKWIEALDRLHRVRKILVCHDFTATPFVPGSGTKTGETLFEWIVSDFGLDDAIESGLVKTPRVVIRETPSRGPDAKGPEGYAEQKSLRPRLYRLYHDPEVKDDLNRKAPPETPLPDLVRNAYSLLGRDWEETATEWKRRDALPVMITVANRTETAGRVRHAFEKRRIEIEGLCDPEGLLHIDSGVLRKAESEAGAGGNGAAGESAAPKRRNRRTVKDRIRLLREQVNTVGRKGEPGERIRNVISVGMLTEGWDAKTVTHIMGLRAFTSQLLCEQVIGRGLRRTSYEVDAETGLFTPEYVNVLGVPFTFLPHEEEKEPLPPKPRVPVEPRPGEKYGISWPRVTNIESRFEHRLALDWTKLEPLRLDGARAVVAADLAPLVDGEPAPEQVTTADLLKWEREYRLQTQIFQTTQSLYDLLAEGWRGSRASFLRQLAVLVEEFIASDRLVVSPPPPEVEPGAWRRLVIRLQMNRVVLHLKKALDFSKNTILVPILDREKAIGSTAEMSVWYTARETAPTKKSPTTVAVCDSNWEKQAVADLDAHPGVERWVKNDHLGFEIFYVFRGVVRKYRPDFLVCFRGGLTLILEIKGRYTEHAKEKNAALRTWIRAINQRGDFGEWASTVCTDPTKLPDTLTHFATRSTSPATPDHPTLTPETPPPPTALHPHPIPHHPAA